MHSSGLSSAPNAKCKNYNTNYLWSESDAELFEDAVSEEVEVSDNVDATATIEETSETDVGDVDTAKEGEQKEVEEQKVEEAEDKGKETERELKNIE